MTGVDRDGDGLLDMHPEETTAQLNRLRAAGQDLDTAWQTARDGLTRPRRLGGGPMGRAFTPTVHAANALKEIAGKIPGFYLGAAAAGADAVKIYQDADATASGAFTPYPNR